MTVLGNSKRSSRELGVCQAANTLRNCLQREGDRHSGAAQLLLHRFCRAPGLPLLLTVGKSLQNGQVTPKNHSTVMLGKPDFKIEKRRYTDASLDSQWTLVFALLP